MKTDDERLKEEAADKLEELDKEIMDNYKELHRVYEIVSIFHAVVCTYLDNEHPEATSPEEQDMLDLIAAARYAIENNTTVDEAKLVLAEELVE